MRVQAERRDGCKRWVRAYYLLPVLEHGCKRPRSAVKCYILTVAPLTTNYATCNFMIFLDRRDLQGK